MSYHAIITDRARQKHADALSAGTALPVADIAWGDGAVAPQAAQSALQNELGRKPVQTTGPVAGQTDTVYFEVLLAEPEGPFVIHEMGLFDTDGDLLAVAHFPQAVNKIVGSTAVFLRMNVAFAGSANVQITVASAQIYAAANRQVIAGVGLTGGGDLSADRRFDVDFASEAEAIAGVSEVKVMSPARTKDAIDDRVTRLVGAAPADLDTLAELAEAIGNDENFVATMMKRTRPRRARRAYLGG